MARWLVGMPFLWFPLRPSSFRKAAFRPPLLSSLSRTSKSRRSTIHFLFTTNPRIDHIYEQPFQLPDDLQTLTKAIIRVRILAKGRRSVPGGIIDRITRGTLVSSVPSVPSVPGGII